MKRTALLLALALAAPAQAADPATLALLQAAINADGGDCPQVTSAAGVGKADTGNVVIRAHCSSEEPWILIMEPDPPHALYECAAVPCAGRRGVL